MVKYKNKYFLKILITIIKDNKFELKKYEKNIKKSYTKKYLKK